MGDVNGQVTAVAGGTTAGQAKETWLEVMFYLSCFFGALHLAGIAGQVGGMVMHTAFHAEPRFVFTSSMLMGHLYLAFLAAYVGPKEFLRWMRRTDDEVLSPTENKKVTRGLYIVIGWALFTGVVVSLRQINMVNEVPETLLYTLGEVVTLFCGTQASKYLRTRQAVQAKQDTANNDNFGDRVLDYAKEHGGIDNEECQREFGLSSDQTYRLLNRLVKAGKLKPTGTGKGTRYILP